MNYRDAPFLHVLLRADIIIEAELVEGDEGRWAVLGWIGEGDDTDVVLETRIFQHIVKRLWHFIEGRIVLPDINMLVSDGGNGETESVGIFRIVVCLLQPVVSQQFGVIVGVAASPQFLQAKVA